MDTAPKVSVIGAGSWGTTVAAIVSEHAPTVLWGRDPELVDAISRTHENPSYLAGIALPDSLRATADLAAACAGKFLGAYGGARAAGIAVRDSAAVGVLMNTRGVIAIDWMLACG